MTVLILSSIGLVATDVYLPSLPFIEVDLSTTEILSQLSLTFYLVSFSLSQLFYGPLSDKIGRRKVAFGGLTLSLFGTLLCIFAPSIYLLILGRLIQGFGLGAGSTLARAIRRDVHSGNDLSHFGSYIIFGTSILFAIAPAIGGYIQHYIGWRFNFLFLLVFTLFGLISVWFWLPETNKNLNPLALKFKFMVHHYFVLLKSPVFMGYSLCSGLAFGGFTAYMTSTPFLFQNIIGLGSIGYGKLGLFIAIGLGAGGIFNKMFVRSLGRDRMLIIGITVMFFSGIVMLISGLFLSLHVLGVMIPMLTYAFGGGITFTNSFAGALDPFARTAGFAGALFGCIQILGGAFGSMSTVLLNEKNQIPLSIILIIIGIITFIAQKIAFFYSADKD
ncbi:MAG: multidrug effflux MFS transporter [Verrucomicrobia bacterium]|nr:multidrug effflux MFS transporter [Verrucomicrobiota bacterium]